MDCLGKIVDLIAMFPVDPDIFDPDIALVIRSFEGT